ncbi:MAG: FAD/NAD(P)-binding protein [Planctomycetota bacterium]|nr:MAG: FAD/NAD(P)-binding protein [Planctomycetota bacterium]
MFIPRAAIIENVQKLTYDTKLYRLKFKYNCKCDRSSESDYKPGQFVQVSVLGAGEAPISICSSPAQNGCFELCVRNVGLVTGALAALKKGDELGIRGPYGNSFPIEELRGQNLIFIAGGIGLAPLRSAIKYVIDNRGDYGKVTILYGARTKEDIVFASELDQWPRQENFGVFTTIDEPQDGWTGNVGVVTTLIDKIKNQSKVKAFVCGPPIMIHFTIKELLDAAWAQQDIITTLERHMKCGVGKCGHCYIGGKYVCTDGPVFTYAQINEMEVEV